MGKTLIDGDDQGKNRQESLKTTGASTAMVPLGRALNACRISCGTGMRGQPGRRTNQTQLGRETFEALLNYAYDRGIRQFDMADMYGTHPYVGRVLKGKPRDEIQLVTKIWPHPGWIPEKERPLADVLVKRFLKELQTDYIDVVQIHGQSTPDWNVRERKQMDALARLKEEGLIRAHGVSLHSVPAMKTAAEEPWVDVVHARVNPFGANADPKDEIVPLLKKLHDAGKGVIGMKLIGEGTFDREQRRETLQFVMDLGSVDCMTVGFEKPEEIDEFLASVQDRLTASQTVNT
ncbi:MAG: aldo/keto reductase [Desulfobacterales bacterium]